MADWNLTIPFHDRWPIGIQRSFFYDCCPIVIQRSLIVIVGQSFVSILFVTIVGLSKSNDPFFDDLLPMGKPRSFWLAGHNSTISFYDRCPIAFTYPFLRSLADRIPSIFFLRSLAGRFLTIPFFIYAFLPTSACLIKPLPTTRRRHSFSKVASVGPDVKNCSKHFPRAILYAASMQTVINGTIHLVAAGATDPALYPEWEPGYLRCARERYCMLVGADNPAEKKVYAAVNSWRFSAKQRQRVARAS